ncbi:hypothetical protein UFOVP75_27 [uncultured Caudovirales phage]|uniref:Uncharacterized protein n=1 Tax=uncultured Caudovirales phage TaxID=2100421 RepID=A0A6J5L0F4_9CAUD|nr:hypothetical protein UFOVP75_27 [uncultured Caudovirales phage]
MYDNSVNVALIETFFAFTPNDDGTCHIVEQDDDDDDFCGWGLYGTREQTIRETIEHLEAMGAIERKRTWQDRVEFQRSYQNKWQIDGAVNTWALANLRKIGLTEAQKGAFAVALGQSVEYVDELLDRAEAQVDEFGNVT